MRLLKIQSFCHSHHQKLCLFCLFLAHFECDVMLWASQYCHYVLRKKARSCASGRSLQVEEQ